MTDIAFLPETESLITEKVSQALCTGKTAMACAEVAIGALSHIHDAEGYRVKHPDQFFPDLVFGIDTSEASGVKHKAYSDAAVADFRHRMEAHVHQYINIAAAAE